MRAVKLVLSAVLLSGLAATGLAQKEPEKPLAELKKIDLKVGKGPAAAKGDTVYVLYKGSLKNGAVFDSNTAPDAAPFNFTIGESMVIEGWHQGFVGMKQGGKRRLEIPSSLGYGPQGNGEKIPPNADLYFEVEVLYVVKAGEDAVMDIKDVKVGTGRTVKRGDLVEVTYTARLLNGRYFEKRTQPKDAVVFRVSDKKVVRTDRMPIAGVREGMIGMREGGVREMWLPPAVAFGYRAPGGIPPSSFVIFEVTVRRIR